MTDHPSYSPFFYRWSGYFARPLVKTYFHIKTAGMEKVPQKGPVIICANHVSYADPVLIAVVLKRNIRFMMLRSYYDKRWIGFLAGLWGSFPVDKDRIDRKVLRTAHEILKSGEILGIFPEGGRSPDGLIKPGKTGAPLIAIREKVPVIPAGIRGAFEAYPVSRRFPRRHPVSIQFGDPVYLHHRYSYPKDKKHLPEMTDQIMEAIRNLSGQSR